MSGLINIKTESQLVDFMSQYSNHLIVCFGTRYGLRNVYNGCYEIIKYKEPHRKNWYNDTEYHREEMKPKESLEFIKKIRQKYYREKKLKRILDEEIS